MSKKHVKDELLPRWQRLLTLEDMFLELQRYTNFEHYSVLNFPAEGVSKSRLMDQHFFTNQPNGWVDTYRERNLCEDDPIYQFAPRTSFATDWRDLTPNKKLNARHKAVLRAAQEFGIDRGVSLSCRQMNGDMQVVTFSGSGQKAFEDIEMNLATQYGHKIGAELHRHQNRIAPKEDIKISARALECLSLSAIGKTSSEMEIILGISRHTVDFHIKNAMKEMNVNSRTFAVVRAVQLGLILPV